MIRRSTETCASCRDFALTESGRALCPWFEQERGWNYPACVLHSPAKDREARTRIVRQLMQKQVDG
jgi:hypothetical protein